MLDITESIQQWILCSNDLWMRWFITREHGAHEFVEVESVLLDAMVIQGVALNNSDLNLDGISTDTFIHRLRVKYRVQVNELRQHCTRQHAGNVFCKPQKVNISAGSIHLVNAIDSMGTMQSNRPYVEVFFDNGFILESPDVLDFVFE